MCLITRKILMLNLHHPNHYIPHVDQHQTVLYPNVMCPQVIKKTYISSSTPYFGYRALNNSNYCALNILWSILEPCNNITYGCTSNTSVCIINSCCSPQAVCLPLSLTSLYRAGNTILYQISQFL